MISIWIISYFKFETDFLCLIFISVTTAIELQSHHWSAQILEWLFHCTLKRSQHSSYITSLFPYSQICLIIFYYLSIHIFPSKSVLWKTGKFKDFSFSIEGKIVYKFKGFPQVTDGQFLRFKIFLVNCYFYGYQIISKTPPQKKHNWC